MELRVAKNNIFINSITKQEKNSLPKPKLTFYTTLSYTALKVEQALSMDLLILYMVLEQSLLPYSCISYNTKNHLLFLLIVC